MPEPVYVDAHGEEDENCQRGVQLFLVEERFKIIDNAWRTGALVFQGGSSPMLKGQREHGHAMVVQQQRVDKYLLLEASSFFTKKEQRLSFPCTCKHDHLTNARVENRR